MIALVEDSITEEELYGEPSQKLLIIDRRTLGILLDLEIPLNFMEPRLIHYFFSIDLVTVRWFIHTFNGDMGNSLPRLSLNMEDIVASASAS